MLSFLKFLLIFQLFSITLLATTELQKEYIVTNKRVMLSDIIKDPKEDLLLYEITSTRHSKRVQASKLLKKLQTYGYRDLSSKHAYIQFSQKSPIDTKPLEDAVVRYYKKYYKNIKIKKVVVEPNRYLTKIPQNYTVGFTRNAQLSHKGIFYIKTDTNKKIFFHYLIDGTINVYETKKPIKKGEELSFLNCQKKSIMLDKFRAMPLVILPRGHYEAKHRIKKFKLLTQRDVEKLFLVKRGAHITVTLQNGGIDIIFSGRALQSGRYGDTITIMHNNNKKIHVVVTGKNRAKVK